MPQDPYAAIAQSSASDPYAAIASATPPSAPGFFKRLGQSLGVPTSEEEFERAISPVRVGGIPIAPGGSGLKAIVDYGKNLYEKGKQFIEQPSAESGLRAVMSATPSGGTQQNIAEDAAAGNYRGAAGGATGLAVQAALPEASKHVAPVGSSLADTVEAIADHPITTAMRKTVDVATFERLGKIYDAWTKEMPAAMRARAEAMKPVFPGEPLGPATPLPEQINPSLVSPARSMPGQIGPEQIYGPKPTPAQPIPARTGLQLTGEVAPTEAPAVPTPQPSAPIVSKRAPSGTARAAQNFKAIQQAQTLRDITQVTVDKVIPPEGDTLGLNKRVQAQVNLHLAQGDVQAAESVLDNAAKGVNLKWNPDRPIVPSVQNIRENLTQVRDAESGPTRPTPDSMDDRALQQEMNWDLEKHGYRAESEARREFIARNSTGVTKADLTAAAAKSVATPGVEDLSSEWQAALDAVRKGAQK